MSVRRIPFGSAEHKRREQYAEDFHASDDAGRATYWGNGVTVMRVTKHRGSKRVDVDVIGEDRFDALGNPFVYSDYFLSDDQMESVVRGLVRDASATP